MDARLKDCPFCGSPAKIESVNFASKAGKCTVCWAEGPSFCNHNWRDPMMSEYKAVEAWNRRKEPTAPKPVDAA